MLGCRQTAAHTHWQGQALNYSAFVTTRHQHVLLRCVLDTGNDAARVLKAAVLTVKPLPLTRVCQQQAVTWEGSWVTGQRPAHIVSAVTQLVREECLPLYTSVRLVVTPMLCMGCRA